MISQEQLSQEEARRQEERFLEGISLPAIGVFKDAEKFNLFIRFMKQYVGEPYKENPPENIRTVNGREINYNVLCLAGFTVSSSHMIAVKRADSQDDLSKEERFFVVTADFGTRDITEWPISRVEHGPKGIKLYLGELEYKESGPNPNDSILNKRRIDLIKKVVETLAKADVPMLALNKNEASRLYWGNFREGEKFIDFVEVYNQIKKLIERYPDEAPEGAFEDILYLSSQSRITKSYDWANRQFC